MDHNLVPPFIMREAGHTVNECPKFQAKDPSTDDHCIIADGVDSVVRVPLQLHGIFSYFCTRKPSKEEFFGCPKVFIIPDSNTWDPYCESYAENERAITDYHGDLSAPNHRHQALNISSSIGTLTSALSALEVSEIVDKAICSSFTVDASTFEHVPAHSDDLELVTDLCQHAEMSKMMGAIGSTHIDPQANDLFQPSLSVSSLTADSLHGVTKEQL
jgi:hypothetical protein